MEEKQNVHINGQFSAHTGSLAHSFLANVVLTRVLRALVLFIPILQVEKLRWPGSGQAWPGQARLLPALNSSILLSVVQVASAYLVPHTMGNIRVKHHHLRALSVPPSWECGVPVQS